MNALGGVYHGGVVLDQPITLRGYGAVIDAGSSPNGNGVGSTVGQCYTTPRLRATAARGSTCTGQPTGAAGVFDPASTGVLVESGPPPGTALRRSSSRASSRTW